MKGDTRGKTTWKRGLFGASIVSTAEQLAEQIKNLPTDVAAEVLNEVRLLLHEASPFKSEPVDCVLWICSDEVTANDYNPNTVAPPEMKLLAHSITEDGYTQPVVAWKNGDGYEVVDGFHRTRVGKEDTSVRKRVHGFIPVTVANSTRHDRGDRIAATIRHNRARGKHRVEAMSDIVVELKRRNWTEERIGRELGMEPDEVLRLCQISGLAEMFADQGFSKSWDVEGEVTASDFEELTDDVGTYGEECAKFRTVNTGDETRIFHTYDKWECYAAGLYATTKEGMTKKECEEAYRIFLSDSKLFADTLAKVVAEWRYSCEHYLTNSSMNRIAWLGQAAACYALGIPSAYRSGFFLLTEAQQEEANQVALSALNTWLTTNGRQPVTMEEAYSGERQSNIY